MTVLKKGFKVVTINGYSCTVTEPFNVKYDPGRWTTNIKGSGPLCVFNAIEGAIKLRVNFGIYSKIMKCLYEEDECADGVWTISRNEEFFSSLKNLPKGTKLAKRVMVEEL